MSNILRSDKRAKNIFLTFIACISIAFLILNSSKTQIITEKIKKNLLPRNLAENIGDSGKTKICEKTSSKFSQYYKTRDKSILGLEEDNSEDYSSKHVQALINIVKHYYKKKESKKASSSILDEEDTEYRKNVFKYLYHILPLVIVLGIGILSLPGWAVCCCCICCKCNYCVCKRPKCKTPSIVLALIFYIIVALISFYSLVEKNKVFSGIADIECAVLRFTDEVLYGETSVYPPYWAGIENIKTTLDAIGNNISALNSGDKVNELGNDFNAIYDENNNGKKFVFETSLKDAGTKIKQNYIDSNYELDIAYLFGYYDNDNSRVVPEKSVYNFWLNEYDSIAQKAKTEMHNTISDLRSIFTNYGSSQNKIPDAKIKLDEIKNEFISLKNLISDKIVEKADEIDKTGRLVYTLFFYLLMIFCAAIVVFMLLLCCCSGKLCTELSCFQCFFRVFIHIFWNLMAIVMFILFMGGSLFTISGTLGDDLVNVVSYLISEDNLGTNSDTIILGNVKQYLDKCFNGDGSILEELGFENSDIGKFESLKKSKASIEELRNQFMDKWNKFVYTEYKEELDKRIQYNSEELSLIELSNNNNKVTFQSLLDAVNNEANAQDKNENWSITSTSTDTCKNERPSEKITYHPYHCFPSDQTWVASLDSGQKLKKIKDFIDHANNNADGIKNLITDLNNKYQSFLDAEIDTLEKFKKKIHKLTEPTEQYASDDDKFFSFMNCNFVKDNVDVILFYLKNSFQNDLYEVGVYLLIAAFSMPFAISFTILLIMISNEDIQTNKKKIAEEKRRKSLKGNSLLLPPTQKAQNDDLNEGNNTEQRHLNNQV